MSEETKEIFNAMKEYKKQKSIKNRSLAQEILESAGINFEIKNNGLHYIITTDTDIIDFWPGTEKFIPRITKQSGKGIYTLIKYIKKN